MLSIHPFSIALELWGSLMRLGSFCTFFSSPRSLSIPRRDQAAMDGLMDIMRIGACSLQLSLLACQHWHSASTPHTDVLLLLKQPFRGHRDIAPRRHSSSIELVS